MANYQDEVKTVRIAPQVKVASPKEDAWVNGLKQIVRQRNEKAGYTIGVYHCPKCKGEETSVKSKTEIAGTKGWCQECGTKLQIKDTISKKKVADIINREAAYKCPSCNKIYRWPVDCCVAKEALQEGEIFETPKIPIIGA